MGRCGLPGRRSCPAHPAGTTAKRSCRRCRANSLANSSHRQRWETVRDKAAELSQLCDGGVMLVSRDLRGRVTLFSTLGRRKTVKLLDSVKEKWRAKKVPRPINGQWHSKSVLEESTSVVLEDGKVRRGSKLVDEKKSRRDEIPDATLIEEIDYTPIF